MGLFLPCWKEQSCSGKLQRNVDLHAKPIKWEGCCSISNQISFKKSDYSLEILSDVHLVNAQGTYYQTSPCQGRWNATASVCPRTAVAPSPASGTGGLARVAPRGSCSSTCSLLRDLSISPPARCSVSPLRNLSLVTARFSVFVFHYLGGHPAFRILFAHLLRGLGWCFCWVYKIFWKVDLFFVVGSTPLNR